MNRLDLNIIVCVDSRKCLWAESYGRSGGDLLAELRHAVNEEGLDQFTEALTEAPRIKALLQRMIGKSA